MTPESMNRRSSHRECDRSHILAVNVGSSSLKFALFAVSATEELDRTQSGAIERIGDSEATWSVARAGHPLDSSRINAPNQRAAVATLLDWLDRTVGFHSLAVVGHRVVHGGPSFQKPELITATILEELRRIRPLDPDHMAGEIEAIEAFHCAIPTLIQVACFDTAFHHDMPRIAQLVPVPRRFERLGVRRYGFHGLSFEFLMHQLERIAGADAARGKVLLAHLGSGASLAAVRDGHCLDTTMGFTPAAGLMMGTRTGDLDPGLVRFLMNAESLTVDQFDHLVNRESGLIGVSETSADVRALLACESQDIRAAEAIGLFCYQTKKWIGAYAAVMGGVDTLVFAGGIGENSPEIRRRICEGLEFLGIQLDQALNLTGASLISAENAKTKVHVIPTDEELMIAQAVAGFRSE